MIRFLTKKKMLCALTACAIGGAVGITLWSYSDVKDMTATNRKLKLEKDWNEFNKYDNDGWVDPSSGF